MLHWNIKIRMISKLSHRYNYTATYRC